MIVFVHGYERETKPELFDAMFRQRKSIFIDQMKWDLKPTDDVYEIDEYDRDDTVYVCSLLPNGDLAGSARLLNTTTDHMASGALAHMFPGLMIRSPTIWEVTRFAVTEDLRIQPNGVSRAACEVVLGCCLFGLQNGVSQWTAIYQAPMARIYKKCGLSHYVLARHRSREFGVVHFALGDISRDLETSIRTATGISTFETVNVAA
jgi:N-acyl-L-homoserine lactone synthetase